LDSCPAQSTVIIILDNCGAELLNDLRLVHYLMKKFRVELHVKSHPTFVSDATEEDVVWHIEHCSALPSLAQMAKDLTQAMSGGANQRLVIFTDPFYTSPLSYKYVPSILKAKYKSAALVILKGDANYRRLVADIPRPFETPLSQVAEISGAVLALRTCKSPIAVGIEDTHFFRDVQKSNPKWCLDGSCGVCQFFCKAE